MSKYVLFILACVSMVYGEPVDTDVDVAVLDELFSADDLAALKEKEGDDEDVALLFDDAAIEVDSEALADFEKGL